jgi:hypothetical protein
LTKPSSGIVEEGFLIYALTESFADGFRDALLLAFADLGPEWEAQDLGGQELAEAALACGVNVSH